MRRLERRIEQLEATQKREETKLSREALTHLSDEDLLALEDALEVGQEDSSATFEDLYRFSSEQSRRAVDDFLECIEALREGREQNVSTEPGEETRSSRNSYLIWKYYRKRPQNGTSSLTSSRTSRSTEAQERVCRYSDWTCKTASQLKTNTAEQTTNSHASLLHGRNNSKR